MILKNPKHERFAQELAKGKTPEAAYKDAGFKPARQNAHRLMTKDDIQTRVQEIVSRATEKVIDAIAVDKEWVMSRLVENANRAMQAVSVNGPDGPTGEYKYEGNVANKALELIGKELGMFIDRSENVNLNADITDKPLSDEEWAEQHVTEH